MRSQDEVYAGETRQGDGMIRRMSPWAVCCQASRSASFTAKANEALGASGQRNWSLRRCRRTHPPPYSTYTTCGKWDQTQHKQEAKQTRTEC